MPNVALREFIAAVALQRRAYSTATLTEIRSAAGFRRENYWILIPTCSASAAHESKCEWKISELGAIFTKSEMQEAPQEFPSKVVEKSNNTTPGIPKLSSRI
jgi:hypothetical protein